MVHSKPKRTPPVTNIQILVAVIVAALFPTITAIIGILLNQNGQTRIENRISVMESDVRRFFQILGEHGGKIDILTADRK